MEQVQGSTHDAPALPIGGRAWRRRSGVRDFARTLLRTAPGKIGCTIILLLIGIALFAPAIAPYSPTKIDVPNRLTGPSARHLFGADDIGRDVFSRVVYGSRISLRV